MVNKHSSKKIKTKVYSSETELATRENILKLFKNCPLPDGELLSNLSLFIRRQELSRLLFMNELYKNILDVHGIIVEFGVRWGRDLALFEALRGIYEPFNHNRKIVGFDTFEGFFDIDEKDGNSDIVLDGAYSVSKNYEEYLRQVLDYHEQESPISHLKKYQIIKGNAVDEIKKYLSDNSETIIALAYFDFDIYKPTKKCLEAIKGHVSKGSVIGFDELNVHDFPGETLALKEIFGLDRYKIRRNLYSSVQSYIIIE